MTVTGSAACGTETAVNISASHQQTTARPYIYFVLKCLNTFANQMLVRNIAQPVNCAHSVALEANHIYLGPVRPSHEAQIQTYTHTSNTFKYSKHKQ